MKLTRGHNTPEPWIPRKSETPPGWFVQTATGKPIWTEGVPSVCSEGDARRIAECVNACEGFAEPFVFRTALLKMIENAERQVDFLPHLYERWQINAWWNYQHDEPDSDDWRVSIRDSRGECVGLMESGESLATAKGRAERVVNCINGCAGIANPAGMNDLLTAAQALSEMVGTEGEITITSLSDFVEHIDKVREGYKNLEAALARVEGRKI